MNMSVTSTSPKYASTERRQDAVQAARNPSATKQGFFNRLLSRAPKGPEEQQEISSNREHQAKINELRISIQSKPGGDLILNKIEKTIDPKFTFAEKATTPVIAMSNLAGKRGLVSLYTLVNSFANENDNQGEDKVLDADSILDSIRPLISLVSTALQEIRYGTPIFGNKDAQKPLPLNKIFDHLDKFFKDSQSINAAEEKNNFLSMFMKTLNDRRTQSSHGRSRKTLSEHVVEDIQKFETQRESRATSKEQIAEFVDGFSFASPKPAEAQQKKIEIPENMPEELKNNFEAFAQSVQNEDKIKQLSKDIRELFAALEGDSQEQEHLTLVINFLLTIEAPSEQTKQNKFLADFSTKLQNITNTVSTENYSNEDYKNTVNDLKKLVLLLPTPAYSKSDDFSQAYEKFVKDLNVENFIPQEANNQLFNFAQIAKKTNAKLTGDKKVQSKFFVTVLNTLREKFIQQRNRLSAGDAIPQADQKTFLNKIYTTMGHITDNVEKQVEKNSSGLAIRQNVLSFVDSLLSQKVPVEQSAAA